MQLISDDETPYMPLYERYSNEDQSSAFVTVICQFPMKEVGLLVQIEKATRHGSIESFNKKIDELVSKACQLEKKSTEVAIEFH